MTEQADRTPRPSLAALMEEYRPSMTEDVMRAWAADVHRALSAGRVVVWMREGATTVMHNFRFDKPDVGPWVPLYYTAQPADPAKASGSAPWPVADEAARKDGWTWDYDWLKSLHLAAYEAGWTTTMEGINFVLSKIATPPASAPEVTDPALFDDALSAAFEKYPHAQDGLTFFACAIRGPRKPTAEDIEWAKSEAPALQDKTNAR